MSRKLQDCWGGFQKIRIDITREGASIIADMENAGINNAEGVNFSVPRKSEMASLLKQRMMNHRFFYPLLNWERPYRGDIQLLSSEKYVLNKLQTLSCHELAIVRQAFIKHCHTRFMKYFFPHQLFGHKKDYVEEIKKASLERLHG